MVISILFSYCNMMSTVIAHFKQSYRFTNVNVKVLFILFSYCNMMFKSYSLFYTVLPFY